MSLSTPQTFIFFEQKNGALRKEVELLYCLMTHSNAQSFSMAILLSCSSSDVFPWSSHTLKYNTDHLHTMQMLSRTCIDFDGDLTFTTPEENG